MQPKNKECGINEFNCDVTRCIHEDKVCDGTDDCEDSTDENDCPEPTTTEVPQVGEYKPITQTYLKYKNPNSCKRIK